MTPDQYAMAIGAGALTGFICAVPVGPVNVAIMEEGIHSGRKRAFIMSAGALIMELIYCVIAFGGFANLFDHKLLRATVELVSLLAVSFFGVKYLMTDTVAVQGKRAKVVEQRLHPHGFLDRLCPRACQPKRPPVLDHDRRRAPGQRHTATGLAKPHGLCRRSRPWHWCLVYTACDRQCPGSQSFLRQDARKLFPSLRHTAVGACRRDRRAIDRDRGTGQLTRLAKRTPQE